MSISIELITIQNSGNYIDEQNKILVLKEFFYSSREDEQLKTSVG